MRFGFGGKIKVRAGTRAALAFVRAGGLAFGFAVARPFSAALGFGFAVTRAFAGAGGLAFGFALGRAGASTERMRALGFAFATSAAGVARRDLALEAREMARFMGLFCILGIPITRLKSSRLTPSVTEIQCANA